MSRPADSHGDWVLWRPEDYGSRAPICVPPALARQFDAEHRQRERERIEQLGAGLYGDKVYTMREIKSLSAALDRGPERSVVRSPSWSRTLEDLAVEMPAFRAVVEVVANAFPLSEATFAPPSIPPLLLVGPPGVGKSYFCRRLTEALESGSAWLSMDQPTAGCALRGTDAHWSRARHGVLFERLALGDSATPVIVLDEIDKAPRRQGSQDIDMLAQLYSALEPETSRHLTDVSLDVDLDANLVAYIATANGLGTLDAALLSRFEVIRVGLPSQQERRESAQRVMESALTRLRVRGVVRVSPGCATLSAEYSPRVIKRAVERAAGGAVADGRDRIGIEGMEVALGLSQLPQRSRMH